MARPQLSLTSLLETCHNLDGLLTGFQVRRPRFDARSGHVGSVRKKRRRGRVYSEYSVSPANFHPIEFSTLSSASGQRVAHVDSVSPQRKKLKKKSNLTVLSPSLYHFHPRNRSGSWHLTGKGEYGTLILMRRCIQQEQTWDREVVETPVSLRLGHY